MVITLEKQIEFIETLGPIVITKSKNGWTAFCDDVYYKDGSFLRSFYGLADNPNDAIVDLYYYLLTNKDTVYVKDAYKSNQKEFELTEYTDYRFAEIKS